jgi:hypothetical protein
MASVSQHERRAAKRRYRNRTSLLTASKHDSTSPLQERLVGHGGCVKVLLSVPDRHFRTKILGMCVYIPPRLNTTDTAACLPMGAGNSPAIAGRMGAAILRQLIERHPGLFQGEPRDHTWQATTEGADSTQRHGYGRVLFNLDDGLPAVLLWVHVDDFLIHGPTYAKTAKALSALFQS